MKKSLLLLVVAIFTLTTAFEANAKWTDRNTFNLKGPVKAVYENNSNYATWEFDEDGDIICEEGDGVNGPQLSRDKNNRIHSVGYWNNYYIFSYNKKGQVSKKIDVCELVENTITYTYNTKGHIIKSVSKYPPAYEIPTEITTYTYQKFDKYGNWIKRTAKTGKTRTVETRTITYY